MLNQTTAFARYSHSHVGQRDREAHGTFESLSEKCLNQSATAVVDTKSGCHTPETIGPTKRATSDS
jgi:hypothetical protein